VCRELERITGQTRERAAWIATPILGLRAGVAALVAVIAAAVAGYQAGKNSGGNR
jgi:hypothetical protein